MMKFTKFLKFSLCDSIIEFRSKSEIEIQILVTMNIFAEAVIPISFWLWSAPQGYAPFRAHDNAGSDDLQGRPQYRGHGWEHNGQPQASMDDNRRKAFMYSTNFRISKKYNLFRNWPVIYNHTTRARSAQFRLRRELPCTRVVQILPAAQTTRTRH